MLQGLQGGTWYQLSPRGVPKDKYSKDRVVPFLVVDGNIDPNPRPKVERFLHRRVTKPIEQWRTKTAFRFNVVNLCHRLLGFVANRCVIDSGLVGSLGGELREQKMLKGHLPRVIYHQVYKYTKRKCSGNRGVSSARNQRLPRQPS